MDKTANGQTLEENHSNPEEIHQNKNGVEKQQTGPKITQVQNKHNQGEQEYVYKREKPLRELKTDLSKLCPINKIYKAYKDIRSTVRRTPLTQSLYLSEKYGANVFLKREDLQIVRSFKLRGALNKFVNLTTEEKAKGVVCASAGNHAQGVAYCCNYMKTKGTIFMPVNAPSIKLRSVRSWGGPYIEVKLIGNTFDECFRAAKKYCEETQSTFVHAYDDDKVIEGQATIAVEILEDFQGTIDYIFICIGGGGLCSGVGSYFKHMSPDTVIVGCEPEGCPSMKLAIDNNNPEPLKSINPFVDGAAVGIPGKRTHEIISNLMPSVLLIPEGVVCSALLDIYNAESIVVEPAGALGIAGLNYYKEEIKGKNVVCVISGSNNDLTRMTDIKILSRVEEGYQYYMLVDFYQKPGALKEFIIQCLSSEDEVLNIEYTKKSNREKGPAIVGIECPKPSNFEKIKQKMQEKSISYKILKPGDQLFNLLL
ncbi:hypothetical protein ABPG74_012318 [Tetrahymena malaccensis]